MTKAFRTADFMQFYGSEQIGPKRTLMPSGFLLCQDVPLARIGKMQYAAGQTPVTPGPNGYVEIDRSPDEVFSPHSLASYNAAPVVDEHPFEDVTPQNWRALSHGVVVNARRGEGDLAEFVVGDIIIKSPEMIAAVQSGKREVSAGYVCDYDEMGPGQGRQRNIVVNHVALVEKGRCGPRCAIGDSAPPEIPAMTVKNVDTSGKTIFQRAIDKLRSSVATKDEAAIEKDLTAVEAVAALGAEQPASMPAIHLHLGDEDPKKDEPKKDDESKKDDDKDKAKDEDPNEARFAAIEGAITKLTEAVASLAPKKEEAADEGKLLGELKEEAPAGTQDSAIATSTKDSAILERAFVETVSLAEVLVPGLQAPAFDKALPAAKTFDSMCGHRRSALREAAKQPAMTGFITAGLGGKSFDTMTCAETRTLFKQAAAVKAAINNTSKTADVARADGGVKVGKITSVAELQKAAKEHYKTHH